MTTEIGIGDTIRHKDVPAGLFHVVVLGIEPCEPADHVAYRIQDPQSGEPDTVCSRDFVLVRKA